MRIEGHFDANLAPRIEVSAVGGKMLELVVDTGFNGELMLPRRVLKELGFPYRSRVRVELADGSIVHADVYEGTILWFGRERVVGIFATRSDEGLLGTQMLFGCRLEVDIDEDRVVLRQKRRRTSLSCSGKG
ncbi:MAG: clan AA aspartic protease [Candidatus Methanomethylicaceae archaeon]